MASIFTIKQMQANNCDDIANYEITKLTQNKIIMRNKFNNKLYRYVEVSTLPCHNLASIPNIISPIYIQTGHLYPADFMTLSSQIKIHIKEQQKLAFPENQLINTIQPILTILQQMHSRGLTHGAVTPENIVVDEEGCLKMYYPGIREPSVQHHKQQENQQLNDFRALGVIMIQLLGFKPSKADDEMVVLRSIARAQKYSQSFIFGLFCMLQKKRKFISKALSLFIEGEQQFKNKMDRLPIEAKELYDNQLLQKNKKQENNKKKQKAEFTPPFNKHDEEITPKKIQQISKKLMKIEDVENKKNYEESKKKKQPTDTVLKKVSNCKAETENTNMQTPNYKKILRDFAAIKRMRTISKKKVGASKV